MSADLQISLSSSPGPLLSLLFSWLCPVISAAPCASADIEISLFSSPGLWLLLSPFFSWLCPVISLLFSWLCPVISAAPYVSADIEISLSSSLGLLLLPLFSWLCLVISAVFDFSLVILLGVLIIWPFTFDWYCPRLAVIEPSLSSSPGLLLSPLFSWLFRVTSVVFDFSLVFLLRLLIVWPFFFPWLCPCLAVIEPSLSSSPGLLLLPLFSWLCPVISAAPYTSADIEISLSSSPGLWLLLSPLFSWLCPVISAAPHVAADLKISLSFSPGLLLSPFFSWLFPVISAVFDFSLVFLLQILIAWPFFFPWLCPRLAVVEPSLFSSPGLFLSPLLSWLCPVISAAPYASADIEISLSSSPGLLLSPPFSWLFPLISAVFDFSLVFVLRILIVWPFSFPWHCLRLVVIEPSLSSSPRLLLSPVSSWFCLKPMWFCLGSVVTEIPGSDSSLEVSPKVPSDSALELLSCSIV